MKKILFFGCIAAALLSIAGCEPSGNDDSMTNYIYLSSDKTSMFEIDNEPIVVEVMLRNALAEDVELTFAVNDDSGIVRLEDNPVLIPAGEKTGYLKIYPGSGDLAATTNYSISLDASVELTADLELKAPFTFALVPVNVEPLTDAQNEIIAAYKETTGIDLSKYLGVVNVSTVLTGVTVDSYVPFNKTVSGKTLIELSEESTAELPILTMTANAMGIENHMYQVLKALTVESEDWLSEEDWADPCYGILKNAINWGSNSTETFSIALDGIAFGAEGAVEFVGTGEDQYGDEIAVVPFSYEFSAYEREKEVIETLMNNVEYWTETATANPAYHLNCTGITEDDAIYAYGEEDEEGNEIYAGETWVKASASVSNDSLVFTFCTATGMDEDYTRVVATYTPNN